ncbi:MULTISPECIES: hypothetical protein [unclassified Mesorhizobium]|uniref:hypothetical protein n=1 Tax=unclassified Mesorhizobium TaxID=325217 RepID=UPI0010933935|nr:MULTISPECIES: hypothetical protein [unclassified Mesorhizobium]TGT91868.1 hypothetical protein EN804_02000 [Mesorhizobium sp. M8A.F.Ca.ET.161.01.1.1]TGV44893.1 hypothetical protein EN785_01995 [Mesorhizobium sp. M8A.F.Ca.ET.142.01.1.1]TJW85746.1 MAG: hypothetical protein E5V92_15030 [Mesorhizobium sp.]
MDPADIYFDLFKRNMDTRRLIILAALGAVLGFGAWLIERDQTKGEMLRPLWQLSSWSWPDYLVLIGLTAAFVVSWSLYFFMLSKIDAVVIDTLADLQELAGLSADQHKAIGRRLNIESKWLPFALSTLIYLGIVIL